MPKTKEEPRSDPIMFASRHFMPSHYEELQRGYKGASYERYVALLPFYTKLYLRIVHVFPQRASSLIRFNEYSAPAQAAQYPSAMTTFSSFIAAASIVTNDDPCMLCVKVSDTAAPTVALHDRMHRVDGDDESQLRLIRG